MHPNKAFAWTDEAQMKDFVGREAFATIVADGPLVAYAPVVISGEGIAFHLSRRNAMADELDGRAVVASVMGRHGFQSANWYESADQVPTWHYEAVQVSGTARRLTDEQLVAQVDRLTELMEGRWSPDHPWTRGKMAPGKFEAMVKAIVGFAIEDPAWRGVRKFNQHKSPADIDASIDGQRRAGRDEVASAIEELRP
jgi:transcriptional regulator